MDAVTRIEAPKMRIPGVLKKNVINLLRDGHKIFGRNNVPRPFDSGTPFTIIFDETAMRVAVVSGEDVSWGGWKNASMSSPGKFRTDQDPSDDSGYRVLDYLSGVIQEMINNDKPMTLSDIQTEMENKEKIEPFIKRPIVPQIQATGKIAEQIRQSDCEANSAWDDYENCQVECAIKVRDCTRDGNLPEKITAEKVLLAARAVRDTLLSESVCCELVPRWLPGDSFEKVAILGISKGDPIRLRKRNGPNPYTPVLVIQGLCELLSDRLCEAGATLPALDFERADLEDCLFWLDRVKKDGG